MSRSTIPALVQDGRFEVVRELGGTEEASSWLVWDPDDDDWRVIKLLSEAYRHRTAVLRSLVRDAKTLERLAHPGLLRVLRTGLLDGRPYLVHEYALGGSAEAWVRRHGPMSPGRAADTVARAAAAVHAAHRAGLLHLGLKPTQLLLAARGLVVGDFGVARATGAHRCPDARWAAPEQDSPDAGPASDVYALGAILRSLVPSGAPLPAPLDAIVRKACDRRPERRYASALALASALAGVEVILREPRLNRPEEPHPLAPPTTEPSASTGRLRRLWEAWVG